jgi:hypothetical protein
LLIVVRDDAKDTGLLRAWRSRFPRLALTRLGEFVPKGKRPAEAIDLENFSGYEHLR